MKIFKTAKFKQSSNQTVKFETEIGGTPVDAYIEVEKGIGELREPGGLISEPQEADHYYLYRLVNNNTGEELPIEEYENEILKKFELIAPDYL